jgi:hypothetical protein
LHILSQLFPEVDHIPKKSKKVLADSI